MTASEERALAALRFVVRELVCRYPLATVAKVLRLHPDRVRELLAKGRERRAGRAA